MEKCMEKEDIKVFEGIYANGIKQGRGKIYNNMNNEYIRNSNSKYSEPKGLNMSGMTESATTFFGGK